MVLFRNLRLLHSISTLPSHLTVCVVKDCSPLNTALPQSMLFSAASLTFTTGSFPSCALKNYTALHLDRLISTLYHLVNVYSIQLLPTFLARDPVTLVHTSREYMASLELDAHQVLLDNSACKAFSGLSQSS